LYVIPHASNPICHCLQQVLDEDAAARAALNDHATSTYGAVVDPFNPSFSTQQPGNVLSFATGYSSSRQIGLHHELTKSCHSSSTRNIGRVNPEEEEEEGEEEEINSGTTTVL
jgi:hypothetical protein